MSYGQHLLSLRDKKVGELAAAKILPNKGLESDTIFRNWARRFSDCGRVRLIGPKNLRVCQAIHFNTRHGGAEKLSLQHFAVPALLQFG